MFFKYCFFPIIFFFPFCGSNILDLKLYLILSQQYLFIFLALLACLNLFYLPVFCSLALHSSMSYTILNSSHVYIFSYCIFRPRTILFLTTDFCSLVKFSILPSIFMNILITVILKSVPDDLTIQISEPFTDLLFLLSVYFPWSFTLVCLVISDECQTLCMKNWTLNDDDVIFYRGFILFSDRQWKWGGEGKD